MSGRIPIFYACDDHFVKYTIVSLRSLMDNCDRSRKYAIHILHTGLSEEMGQILLNMADDVFSVELNNVGEFLPSIQDKLPIRDYFTSSTYFRMFIPEMFPTVDKAIYIDSDTIVAGNIAEMYDHDLADRYIGAVNDQVMLQIPVFGEYTERVLGIDRYAYFTAGILLLNCRQFREKKLFDKFVALLGSYNFVVAQDQDYLNILCKDRVLWLNRGWNMQVLGTLMENPADYRIIHYVMASKPWHYDNCRLQSYFWQYAEKTPVLAEIKADLAAYTDAQRQRDAEGGERLMRTAQSEIDREDNYLKRQQQRQAPDRLAVQKRIEELEEAGIFDRDVEDDPPAPVLKPEDIDYFRKGLYSKLKTQVAFSAAQRFVDKAIREKRLIIEKMVGVEHFAGLESGAVVTCNHFNPFDSFAIQLAYQASGQKGRKFYRVIREGNYTNFPGFYGFLMKNCDTLPLSSDMETMKKFISSTDKLLQEGNFVLFYPEQSMWWNYRKPKPLKDGAYKFAAKNRVPVLPCFITMRDSDVMGEDGFPVQAYTIHVGAPIYPEAGLSQRENVRLLRDTNAKLWQEIYETDYGIALRYRTKVSV